jgi:hypothetical protein
MVLVDGEDGFLPGNPDPAKMGDGNRFGNPGEIGAPDSEVHDTLIKLFANWHELSPSMHATPLRVPNKFTNFDLG